MEEEADSIINNFNQKNQKKKYENPFKGDNIYNSHKIKSKKITFFKKDNLNTNNYSNTIKKINQETPEKNILKQNIKSDLSRNHFSSNSNIFINNKIDIKYISDKKVNYNNTCITSDFKRNSTLKKLIGVKRIIKNTIHHNNKETKTIFNKIKGKKIFGNSSKIICKKKINEKHCENKNIINHKVNTESTLNILNKHKFRLYNKTNIPNIQNIPNITNIPNSYNSIVLKKSEGEIKSEIINKNQLKSDKMINNQKSNIKYNYTKSNNYININKLNNKKNFFKNHINYNSDANILTEKLKKKKNKLKYIDNYKNNKKSNININTNNIKEKINKNSNNINKEKIIQDKKRTTEVIIKVSNSTLKANNNSANTKPTNISSFIIYEKNNEQNTHKINESPVKRTNFKEHMKFINLNTNQIKQFLLDNYSKTKESESKFLNYDLGQTNGLSIMADSLLCSFDNSYNKKFDKKNGNQIIEYEHSLEYMERIANEMLGSSKNLKKIKESYCELVDNISIDEMKEGEDIHRIINLPINFKK